MPLGPSDLEGACYQDPTPDLALDVDFDRFAGLIRFEVGGQPHRVFSGPPGHMHVDRVIGDVARFVLRSVGQIGNDDRCPAYRNQLAKVREGFNKLVEAGGNLGTAMLNKLKAGKNTNSEIAQDLDTMPPQQFERLKRDIVYKIKTGVALTRYQQKVAEVLELRKPKLKSVSAGLGYLQEQAKANV